MRQCVRGGVSGIVALVELTIMAGLASGYSIDGFTEPFRKIDIAAAEMGTIASLNVREGDRIRRGELLATLDCEVLAVSLEIAEASRNAHGRIDSAQAECELRRSRLHKIEELRGRGHASGDEVERARTDLLQAEANLLIAREQHALDALEYKKAEAMLERRMVRSPIDGVVTRLHKEEHEFVAATSAAVLTVVQLDPLRVTFSVPTSRVGLYTPGGPIKLFFPESEQQATGQVEMVSPITEAESGTVRLKVLLPNADGKYRSGVRCSLELDGDAPSPVATVR